MRGANAAGGARGATPVRPHVASIGPLRTGPVGPWGQRAALPPGLACTAVPVDAPQSVRANYFKYLHDRGRPASPAHPLLLLRSFKITFAPLFDPNSSTAGRAGEEQSAARQQDDAAALWPMRCRRAWKCSPLGKEAGAQFLCFPPRCCGGANTQVPGLPFLLRRAGRSGFAARPACRSV